MPAIDDPIWTLRRDPIAFFSALAERGDVVPYRDAPARAVLVNHPEHVRRVLATHARQYPKDTFAAQSSAARLLFGGGLVLAEAEPWRRRRKLVAPAFHRERVAAIAGTIVRVAREHASAVEAWPERQLDVSALCDSLSLRVLGDTLFGADVDVEDVRAAFTVLLAALPPRRPPDDDAPLRAAAARLDTIASGIVRARRLSGVTRNDLLQTLMDARDEDDQPLDDTELRDEIVTLLVGGHENTALALAWTLWFLAGDRDAQAAVHAELDAVLGSRAPDASDLARLTFLRACLDESLRLRPPVWAYGRSAIADDELAGVSIPAGTSITICPYAMHRHPAFFEEPELFRPARFLDRERASERRAAFMPYGAGERLCVGLQLANVEAVLVLAVLLQRIELSRDPTHTPVLAPGVSLAPRDAIRVIARERR